MLTSLALAATLWPLAVTEHCAPETDDLMVGVARTAAGSFLYCELVSRRDAKSLRVRYTQSGKLFAEKRLDFTHSAFSPSVVQQDFRFGELRKADINAQILRLSYQPSSHKKINIAEIATHKVDVIDAGFDNFIRANWSLLRSNTIISVNFASIAHLKTLPLRISSTPVDACLSNTPHSRETACFLVEVDNAFLRLLLGNIKLAYDQQQRLIQFNGVVNIVNDKAASQTATIHYYYHEDYVQK